jgi:hypothetical protein
MSGFLRPAAWEVFPLHVGRTLGVPLRSLTKNQRSSQDSRDAMERVNHTGHKNSNEAQR